MEKIWVKDQQSTMNYTAGFVCKINKNSAETILRVAGASAFRIFIDGTLTGYGPRRSAHGYSIINSYDITSHTCVKDCIIAVEVAGYNNNSFNIVMDKPFFSAEVISGGKIIADTLNFKAYHISSKLQKCERYSYQRNFAEAYVLNTNYMGFYDGNPVYEEVPVEKVNGNILIEAKLPYADFKEIKPAVIESGSVFDLGENSYVYQVPEYAKLCDTNKGYYLNELEINLSKETGRLGYKRGEGIIQPLSSAYWLCDLGKNKTGFISLEIEALEDSEIYITFDEILYEELKENPEFKNYFGKEEKAVVFFRSGTLNLVKYSVQKGRYKLLTFEPYTMRYYKIAVSKGCVKIIDTGLKLYENTEADRLEFKTENELIQKVFDAAQSTFAQNAVDVLTDCPSRERAGWLCDSYFSAKAELLFTGKNDIEKNFLNNFLIMPRLKELPAEMLPMCYPSDHLNGIYIPNWSMWMVLELEDYVLRTGDRELPEKFREKLVALAEFFIKNYSNEYSLLEKLDSWVFLEWSRANDLTQDVNYPSNMLFAAMLKSLYNLYGIEKYLALHDKIKDTIIEQSYNGLFFEDNRKRINGVLQRQNESTETCQYYAFYFKIADKERFPKLYNTMLKDFGPERDILKVYPEVSKSNAFIGNYLRLDFLRREGLIGQVIEESLKYFGYMADRTLTLWENDKPHASCCHGFASYAANWLIEAVTGYSGVDLEKKEVILRKPVIETKFNAKIPVEDGYLNIQSGKEPVNSTRFSIRYI